MANTLLRKKHVQYLLIKKSILLYFEKVYSPSFKNFIKNLISKLDCYIFQLSIDNLVL